MREWREDVLLGTILVSTACSLVPGRLVSRVLGRGAADVRLPLNDGPMVAILFSLVGTERFVRVRQLGKR